MGMYTNLHCETCITNLNVDHVLMGMIAGNSVNASYLSPKANATNLKAFWARVNNEREEGRFGAKSLGSNARRNRGHDDP
jgi:hypothetical protein